MENLKKLSKLKPKIGWGESSNYEETAQDIHDIVEILDGGMMIVAARAAYNQENENNADRLTYHKWLDHIRKPEDSYVSYMLNEGYLVRDGNFVLNVSLEKLNHLAGIYISYLKDK